MSRDEKQRILIVDDDRLSRKVMAAILDSDYTIILAKDGTQAVERVCADPPPDLVLLDVMMSEFNGYQVIQQFKDLDAAREIPVIFVTALDSTDDEEKGLKLGAVDYITKPFHPSIVRARIRNHMRFIQQRKLLDEMAHIDSLTQIPNRRKFQDVLPMEWQRAARNSQPLSLALIDIDFFKQFNDIHGHAVGDDVLKTVAQVITNGLQRPSDLVARYGGDEFVVLCPETDKPGAMQLLERVREMIENTKIQHIFSQELGSITVSIGGVTCSDTEGLTMDDFFISADAELYAAKHQDRNKLLWRTLS